MDLFAVLLVFLFIALRLAGFIEFSPLFYMVPFGLYVITKSVWRRFYFDFNLKRDGVDVNVIVNGKKIDKKLIMRKRGDKIYFKNKENKNV